MERIERLTEHPLFKKYMQAIESAEETRRFCRHGYEHGLNVARICYIISLEEKLVLDKEIIYAMALLHDIGRAVEYENGSSHHVEGAELARRLLLEADFSADETDKICRAILNHKTKSRDDEDILADILYKADKLSRSCFSCKAYEDCYWSEEIKNKRIIY